MKVTKTKEIRSTFVKDYYHIGTENNEIYSPWNECVNSPTVLQVFSPFCLLQNS